jgi:LuxR family quorum sensing-dependent transcriptional regulator
LSKKGEVVGDHQPEPLPSLPPGLLDQSAVAAVLFEQGAAIVASHDLDTLRAATSAAVQALGYRYLTCVTVRRLRNTFLHEANFQTWPLELVRRFADRQLFRHDPIVARSRTSQQAFFWSLADYDLTIPQHREIVDIRVSVGIDCGCCVPFIERVGGIANARLVLHASGHLVPECPATGLALQMLAGLVTNRLASFNLPPEPRDQRLHFFEATGLLTMRERTILSWIASGKSSWEIARILNISEHTVNTHIEKSLVKLDATNRTEAAIKAMILNEFSLGPTDGTG